MPENPTHRLRVHAMAWQSPTVLSVVLESIDRTPLPAPVPGAHVDLRLAPGLSRSYSIVGNADRPFRYEIAVAKDAKSRGGSRFVHERLRVGDELDASAPRNLFPLQEETGHSLLIAGGIGITPIWSMVRRLETRGRAWTLLYAARSRRHAAYLEEIEHLATTSRVGRLITHFDDEHGGLPLEMHAALQKEVQPASHVYCCGPHPMLTAFEAATSSLPPQQVHLERFTPAPSAAAAADATPFTVVLRRSSMTLAVAPDQSILDALLEAGVDAPYGCMQGTCGMCETAVLEGQPEHRDHLLSDEVKAGNRAMLICCSRNRSPELVLDI